MLLLQMERERGENHLGCLGCAEMQMPPFSPPSLAGERSGRGDSLMGSVGDLVELQQPACSSAGTWLCHCGW